MIWKNKTNWKYQIFFSHKAENKAIDGSQLVFAVNKVKNSKNPAKKKDLEKKIETQVGFLSN